MFYLGPHYLDVDCTAEQTSLCQRLATPVWYPSCAATPAGAHLWRRWTPATSWPLPGYCGHRRSGRRTVSGSSLSPRAWASATGTAPGTTMAQWGGAGHGRWHPRWPQRTGRRATPGTSPPEPAQIIHSAGAFTAAQISILLSISSSSSAMIYGEYSRPSCLDRPPLSLPSTGASLSSSPTQSTQE